MNPLFSPDLPHQFRFLLRRGLLLVVLLTAVATAQATDTNAEYAQVRRIAARDEKVRAAFARANERLDERILALDPALAGYVRLHPSGGGLEPAEAPARRYPSAKPAPAKPAAPDAPAGKTHVVAAGETLSSIAKENGVSVAKLQSANHIEDARKLRVGQTLTLP